MSKINFSVPLFDQERAMELANLLTLANEQFQFYAERKDWSPAKSKKLIGSNTFDFDPRIKKNNHLIEYDLLAILWFTEVNFLEVETVPFGFIAQQSETNNIFIVFRGTRESSEWLDDVQFKQVTFLSQTNLGSVSSGFNKIYTRSYDDLDNPLKYLKEVPADRKASLQQTIIDTLDNCAADAQVFITGHSLGGALATLATLHIAAETKFQNPTLYSFASPRVGNKQFAESFINLNLKAFRIANSEDIIPTLPPATSTLMEPEMISSMNSTQVKRLNALKRFVSIFSGNLSDQQYDHIGESMYFTDARGSISSNHCLEVTYREALKN
jgi:hypothetical protein